MRYCQIVQEARALSLSSKSVQSGLRRRFRVLTLDDLRDTAVRYDTADAFANLIADPESDTADVARGFLRTLWRHAEQQADQPKAPVDALANLSPLRRFIGQQIGATQALAAREPLWGRDLISSPGGIIFTTPQGRVFLDAEVIKREVWLAEISVEKRGFGLGTKVMQAIHRYAMQRGLGVCVWKVTNLAFFDRFDWLVADDRQRGTVFRSTFNQRGSM